MNKVSSKKKIKTNNKMLEECGICCEEMTNKGKKILIECPACDFKCCRACIERWLLSELEPSCMKCKSKWTKVKCQELLGKGFMNGKHRKHTKDILFNIEKARFPDTMPEVEIVVKKNNYAEMNTSTRAELYKLQEEIRKKEKIIRDREYFITYGHERGENHTGVHTERKKFMKACPKNDCEGFLSPAWKCAVCECHVCKDCEIVVDDKNTHTCDPNILASAKLLKKETKPCPSCASAIYKISGCDQMWCTQCNIAFSWNTGKKVRGAVHNPHYYEWIKNGGGQAVVPGAMLPCGGLPTAYTVRDALQYIILPDNFRKEGNEIDSKSLFATLQNTRYLQELFSKCNLHVIEAKWFDSHNKKIHFPTDGGKNIESFSVADRLYANEKGSSEEIEKICYKYRARYDEHIKESIKVSDTIRYLKYITDTILSIHQAISHFVNVELDRQRRKVNNNRDSVDLRIKYIMKKIDEKSMKTSLLKRERAMNKEIAILDIFEVYARVCSDCIRSICQNKQTLTIAKLIDEYDKIQRINIYCNKELFKYQATFNLVTPEIKLKSGWCQTRGHGQGVEYYDDKGKLDIEKLYTMKPIYPITNLTLTPISVFDFNFIKTWIRIKRNITRYGRRWTCLSPLYGDNAGLERQYRVERDRGTGRW